MTIDTMNKFGVGLCGESIVLLGSIPRQLSRSDALTLAAWLVVLADNRMGKTGGEFQQVLTEICNS